MNSHIPPDVGDANVERLIGEAYQPEPPAPTLLPRVTERMLAAAKDAPARRQANRADAQRILSFRRRLTIGASVAAMAAGILVVIYGFNLSHRTPKGPGVKSPVAQPINLPAELTARPRAAVKPPEQMKLGVPVVTKDGERRRVVLPDGSILYVNQNTTVVVDANRRLNLTRGEVFVEVMPQESKEKFTVKTGHREVTALGTKFAVTTDDKGQSSVVVTQGRVKVSGDVERELTAGERLQAGEKTASPAVRASYALEWTKELMAAAETPLVPGSQYTGGALVAVDPYGQEAKLTLRKYKVDVHIEDGFARTIIDQTYFNHAPSRMEGTFYFPLPADASLSRLAMYVDGKLMEGGMAEREYARQVFEEIVSSQRDPALLEWLDGSTFKMRVFPLESRQEKRIIIGYTQRLSSLYSHAQYRFPAGHNLGLVKDWSFEARIKGGAKTILSSDSHALLAQPQEDPAKANPHTLIQEVQGQDVVLKGRLQDAKLDRDVTLNLIDPEAGVAGARFSVAETDDGAKYLMLRYRPEVRAEKRRETRDWVFLFESSGDRDPLLARVQIDVIRTLLDNAEHGDTFRIVTAGTRTHEFDTEARPATRENIVAAVDFLNHSHLIGALDLNRALTAAAERLPQAGDAARASYLVHVGTGVAAMGEHRPDVLAKLVPTGTRYVGVAVGKRWSRDFMKTAAERTGGYYTQINPDEQVSWRAFDLAATLNTPRLMNVEVKGGTPFLTFANALSQGEELCAVTRLTGNTPLPAAVTVTGAMLDGKAYVQTIPLPADLPKVGHLPRTWAKLEIEGLLADGSEKNRSAIIDLSKAMYVMTPFTSLLVLENEEMYQRFKVDRGRKDHWAPYGMEKAPAQIPVVYEPLFGQPIDARFAPKTEKPHANQILQTIYVRQAAPALTSPNQPQHYNPWNQMTALQVYRGAFAAPINANLGEDDLADGDFGGDAIPAKAAAAVDFQRAEKLLFAGARGERAKDSDKSRIMDILDGKEGKEGGKGKSEGRRQNQQLGEDRKQLQSRFRSLREEQMERRLELAATPSAPQQDSFGGRNGMDRGSREALAKANSFYRFDELKKVSPERVSGGIDAARKQKRGEEVILKQMRSLDLADEEMSDLVYNGVRGPDMYGRPSFTNFEQVFTDLLAYAPGMKTSQADIEAVLEAEALPGLGSLPGTLDPEAKKIIDAARTGGWRTLTLSVDGEDVKVVFDGAGRYAYARTLAIGLREQVVCDGATVLHLYPDIGVAARRTVTRFHRAQFAKLVPWMLLPAEDLARGADVQKLDDHTVALIPRGADAIRNEDGKPVAYHRTHLVFADGQLAARQLVEVAADRKTTVVFTEKYEAGVVRQIDAENKETSKRELKLTAAEQPDLKPDVAGLVVLPMPWRTPEVVAEKYGIDLGVFADPNMNWTLTYTVSPEAGDALLAAAFAQRNVYMVQTAHRLFARDNRTDKLGYYTLLAALDVPLANDAEFTRFAAAQADRPLARYLSLLANPLYRNLHTQYGLYFGDKLGEKGTLLARLAGFRDLYLRWQQGNVSHKGTPMQQRVEQERALAFVRENHTSEVGWAMLSILQDQAHDSRFQTHIALAWKLFDDGTELGYTSAYEEARSLLRAGRKTEAAACFQALYQRAFDKGLLPPIDGSFRSALLPNDANPKDLWTPLTRQTAQKLLEKKQRTAVVRLAWQAYQVDDAPLAENLLELALANPATPEERLQSTVAAVEYLMGTNQDEKADALLTALLEDAEFAKRPMLWRLGSQTAQRRGLEDVSIFRLEQALDREYSDLPEIVNLQHIRADYGRLLNHYRWLAGAVAAMKIDPPADLLPRTIRAADRCGALDRDSAAPCQQAADILKELAKRVPNAQEMAWDYMTTPIGMQPNQSAPWANLGHRLTKQNDLALADLAFKAATEADPKDAQLLWDRAQNLRRASKLAESQKLLRQIVDGKDWGTRFGSLVSQARWQLEGRK